MGKFTYLCEIGSIGFLQKVLSYEVFHVDKTVLRCFQEKSFELLLIYLDVLIRAFDYMLLLLSCAPAGSVRVLSALLPVSIKWVQSYCHWLFRANDRVSYLNHIVILLFPWNLMIGSLFPLYLPALISF